MSLRSIGDQMIYEHDRFGEPFPDPLHRALYAAVRAIPDIAASAMRLARHAVRYSAKRYEAFRVSDGKRTSALYLNCEPASLQEALNAAMIRCFHKDFLVINETDEANGEMTLHTYAIKRKSRPTYVYRDYVTTRVHDLYAEQLFAFDGEAVRQIGRAA